MKLANENNAQQRLQRDKTLGLEDHDFYININYNKNNDCDKIQIFYTVAIYNDKTKTN